MTGTFAPQVQKCLVLLPHSIAYICRPAKVDVILAGFYGMIGKDFAIDSQKSDSPEGIY